jgi:hypothetical protein
VQFLPRDILTARYEDAAELLSGVAGLPTAAHVLILDGLEKLTIGTALIESSSPLRPRQALFTNLDAGRYPHLTAAAGPAPWTPGSCSWRPCARSSRARPRNRCDRGGLPGHAATRAGCGRR